MPKIKLPFDNAKKNVKIIESRKEESILYSFLHPLPREFKDCKLSEFCDTNIDWRMLIPVRPLTKLNEDIFTRFVEMSRFQYATKQIDSEEKMTTSTKSFKGRYLKYVYESESSSDDVTDDMISYGNFEREDISCTPSKKYFKNPKSLNSKELVEKLSELMSGKINSPRVPSKVNRKKKKKRGVKADSGSSKNNSRSEESDLGSSDNVITPPVTAKPDKRKIFTKRVKLPDPKTRSPNPTVEKHSLPKLDRNSKIVHHTILPNLDRPATAKKPQEKVIYIRLPQIEN